MVECVDQAIVDKNSQELRKKNWKNLAEDIIAEESIYISPTFVTCNIDHLSSKSAIFLLNEL